jgi:hypothetical protein
VRAQHEGTSHLPRRSLLLVMQTVLQTLDHGWIGALLAAIGIGVPFYIYYLSNVGPRLVYQARALRLIGQNELLPSQVKIFFDDRIVTQLTKTYLVIWNPGKALIRGSDIVAGDPPRCEFSSDSEILDVRIVKATKTTNKASATISQEKTSEAHFTFDYLDPEDGVVLELLHTAPQRFPTVTGSVRGMTRGIENWGRIRATVFTVPPPFSILYRLVKNKALVFNTFQLSLVTVAAAGLYFAIFPVGSTDAASRAGPAVMAALYFGLATFIFWTRRRRFPKALNISDFE